MPKDRLLFEKTGRARYISHLDLMRTFQRAFLRADIPIKHTEGFNPHPFISIALPLPLGFSSSCEILEFGLLEGTRHGDVPVRLNAVLPEGVTVKECYPGERPLKELESLEYVVDVEFSGDRQGLIEAWSRAMSRGSWVIEKKSKKAKSGVTTLDMAPLIKGFSFTGVKSDGIQLACTLAAQNPGLNPSVMVTALTEEFPDFQPSFVSYRRAKSLDGAGKEFH